VAQQGLYYHWVSANPGYRRIAWALSFVFAPDDVLHDYGHFVLDDALGEYGVRCMRTLFY